MRINDAMQFAWQAQYLVKLEGASCCSAHCKCHFIYNAIQFAWQAQYLVKLEGASCCSAHCKCRFICHADQSRDSFCVARAVFGEVGWCLLIVNDVSK